MNKWYAVVVESVVREVWSLESSAQDGANVYRWKGQSSYVSQVSNDIANRFHNGEHLTVDNVVADHQNWVKENIKK